MARFSITAHLANLRNRKISGQKKILGILYSFLYDIFLGRNAEGVQKQAPEINFADFAHGGKLANSKIILSKSSVHFFNGRSDQGCSRLGYVLLFLLLLHLINAVIQCTHSEKICLIVLAFPRFTCCLEIVKKRFYVSEGNRKGLVEDFRVKIDGVASTAPVPFNVI